MTTAEFRDAASGSALFITVTPSGLSALDERALDGVAVTVVIVLGVVVVMVRCSQDGMAVRKHEWEIISWQISVQNPVDTRGQFMIHFNRTVTVLSSLTAYYQRNNLPVPGKVCLTSLSQCTSLLFRCHCSPFYNISISVLLL